LSHFLNPAQRKLHEIIEQQRAKTGRLRVIVLKARQLGVSTYVAARFPMLTRVAASRLSLHTMLDENEVLRAQLAQARGYALANAGHDTRAFRTTSGTRRSQHTVRFSVEISFPAPATAISASRKAFCWNVTPWVAGSMICVTVRLCSIPSPNRQAIPVNQFSEISAISSRYRARL
jgi:hypothetical protein